MPDPTDLTARLQGVIDEIQQLQRDVRNRYPNSRIVQMMAVLLADAAHAMTELVSSEAGDVRPPKMRGVFAALRRLPSMRDLR